MEACRPIIEAAKIIGFGFDVELLLLARRAGLRLREIPVQWNHHEGSKVRFVHDSVRMLREVLSLRANNAVISKAESFTGEKPDSR
jgi:dolichyl-phosphate beta-glucosyltransferase